MLYNRVGKRKKTMAPDTIIEKRLIIYATQSKTYVKHFV